MSTDRELLEMAAKAAGMAHKYNPSWHAFYLESTSPFDGSRCWDPHSRWNPLEDDGDAFRLLRQVDYGLLVEDGVVKIMNKLGGCMLFLEIRDADEMTVIRRAITMSAAEKGRRMP